MVFINNLSMCNQDLNGVPSTLVITYSSGDEVSYIRKVGRTEEEKLQPLTNNIQWPKYDFGKFDLDGYDFRSMYAVCTKTLSTMKKQFQCSLEEADGSREKAKKEIDRQYQNWERQLRIDYSSVKKKWQRVWNDLEAPEGRSRMVSKLLEESNLKKAPSVIKMLGIETEFVVKRMEGMDLKFETFISHVQKDSGDLCGRLSDALSHAGLSSWYDMKSAKLDTRGIIGGVIDCKTFTVVLTKDYFERQWCLFELSIAVVADKPIVVIHEGDPRFGGGHLNELNIPKQFKQITSHEILKVDRRYWKSFFSAFEQAIKERQIFASVLTDEIERIKTSSNILNKNSDIKFLRGALKSSGWKFGSRIFCSLTDGFTAKNFHDKCDHKGATLTVLKRKDELVFGGFLPISFEQGKSWKWIKAPKAWLFDLEDRGAPKLLDAGFGEVMYYSDTKAGPHFTIYAPSGVKIVGFGVHGVTTGAHYIRGVFAGNRETDWNKIEIDQYEVFQLIKTD